MERAECGAGAPDGLVRGDADHPVVCGGWPCGSAGEPGAVLVPAEGDADILRHAGGVAIADVAAAGLWGFGYRVAVTGMPRNATPDALRSGIAVRKASKSHCRIAGVLAVSSAGKGLTSIFRCGL